MRAPRDADLAAGDERDCLQVTGPFDTAAAPFDTPGSSVAPAAQDDAYLAAATQGTTKGRGNSSHAHAGGCATPLRFLSSPATKSPGVSKELPHPTSNVTTPFDTAAAPFDTPGSFVAPAAQGTERARRLPSARRALSSHRTLDSRSYSGNGREAVWVRSVEQCAVGEACALDLAELLQQVLGRRFLLGGLIDVQNDPALVHHD